MEQYFTANQVHLDGNVDLTYIHNNPTDQTSRSLATLGIDSLIYLKNLQTSQQTRKELDGQYTYTSIAKGLLPNTCYLGTDLFNTFIPHIGTQSGIIFQYNIQTESTKQIYKCDHQINALCTSPKHRYLAVCSEQYKLCLIDLQTYKTSKCRPGHDKPIIFSTFSHDQQYVASIGEDKCLLIFKIDNFEQPIEQYRYKICKESEEKLSPNNNISWKNLLKGSFHKHLSTIFYSPGHNQVQIVELLNGRWEHRLSQFVRHREGELILLVAMIKTCLLITSSYRETFIWNNRNEEKIMVIDNCGLGGILEIGDSLYAINAVEDGKFLEYKRVINESDLLGNTTGNNNNTRMQLQEQKAKDLMQLNEDKDVINFDDDADDDEEDRNENDKMEIDQDDNESEKERIYQQYLNQGGHHKKSKADKIITSYPQGTIDYKTSFFENCRYLYTSTSGYIVERIEADDSIVVEIEFQDDSSKNKPLFKDKPIDFVDLNDLFVLYADTTTFGVRFHHGGRVKLQQYESWEKKWWEIVCVCSSYEWVAIANEMEIKIFDLTSNEIGCIAFDRQIVGMTAYENLLVVAYHEGIPMYGTQLLKMQIFVINNYSHCISSVKSQQQPDSVSSPLSVIKFTQCHIPIRPKSELKYFRFTQEGMLLSRDSDGFIRVYNLQNNEWTSIFVEGVDDIRRLWLLGMQNYKLVYWKTAQRIPDPQVFPRLPIKQSRLSMMILIQDTQQLLEYPFWQFQRFVLDHQKSRNRLWGPLKSTRPENHPGYFQSQTILPLKQQLQRHNQLDYKFYDIIKYYLKAGQSIKAVTCVKSLIRTLQAGKNLIELFDDFKFRNLAVDLESFYEIKEKSQDHEMMLELELDNLKVEAERSINSRSNKANVESNIWKKKKTQTNSNNSSALYGGIGSIPSLNSSQQSQDSQNDSMDLMRSIEKNGHHENGNKSKENGMKMANKSLSTVTPQKSEVVNPFAKKKSTTSDEMSLKTKEIEDEMEKYGIKKKADIPKKINGNRN